MDHPLTFHKQLESPFETVAKRQTNPYGKRGETETLYEMLCPYYACVLIELISKPD